MNNQTRDNGRWYCPTRLPNLRASLGGFGHLHASNVFCPTDKFSIPNLFLPALPVSACILFVGVCSMFGLGCCCGAMLEQGQQVEGVVRLFVCLFVHEGMEIMVWENGGTLMQSVCVMDSYSDSYRNRTTKRRSLWCEYHVGCVHDRVMYSLFENVSNRRSCSSQRQCTMVQL